MIEIDGERIRMFKSNTRAEYDRYSQVRKIVSSGLVQLQEPLEFIQIGSRFHIPIEVLIESHSGPNVAPNIVGLGQSIAIGEMNYLLKQFQLFVSNRDHTEQISFDSLLKLLTSYNLEPRSVLIPLDFYSALHLGKFSNLFVDYSNYDPYLVLGWSRIPIYWSNNYVPFDEFIFVGNELGHWVVKPDPKDGHALTIDVQGMRDGKVDVIIKTVACFAHGNSKSGLIVDVHSPKKKLTSARNAD
jgi:hypothetical protein